MARYILDTGVLLGYLRGSLYAAYIDQQYSPFTLPNIDHLNGVFLTVTVIDPKTKP